MTTEHQQLEAQLAAVAAELGLWCWINKGPAIRQHGAGMADALVIGEDQMLFVELKSAEGRRTRPQAIFGRRVEERGCSYRLYRQADFDAGTVRADLADL